MADAETNLVEVEILGIVTTAQYGSLNTGDILRTTPDFAKHLVEDCSAARYRTEEEPAPSEEEFEVSVAHADPAEGAAVARRGRRAKQ
ncbi:hypothetical protein [Massilia sp.]|uniref:hypothetical protein n=1 Tax=Massilia sp. TaxID=1882437 RepID=UPI00352CC05A